MVVTDRFHCIIWVANSSTTWNITLHCSSPKCIVKVITPKTFIWFLLAATKCFRYTVLSLFFPGRISNKCFDIIPRATPDSNNVFIYFLWHIIWIWESFSNCCLRLSYSCILDCSTRGLELGTRSCTNTSSWTYCQPLLLNRFALFCLASYSTGPPSFPHRERGAFSFSNPYGKDCLHFSALTTSWHPLDRDALAQTVDPDYVAIWRLAFDLHS